MVEVRGPGHPTGDPLVGFYRVRDGKVIKHIFMDASITRAPATEQRDRHKDAPRATGRCLCAVRYEAYGLLRDILLCHCKECRRWTGYLGRVHPRTGPAITTC